MNKMTTKMVDNIPKKRADMNKNKKQNSEKPIERPKIR